ncbi:MAG: 2,3-bisphosphoglycerate-independent phosphoglycerate mutase [Acidimicrobiia bacterium]|nr:2,3-bisphosphoglycerate-independent phosphoglycerate mutase [Acidimicrobiia bacterium]
MKHVVFVPDGCADEPLPQLDGRTPLEAASMPNLAAMALRSEVGLARVIPEGMAPGSDVGNMSILGYDPTVYHSGRAPIEAAAMGIELAADEVAYRCNLVTLSDADEPVMIDFAAGHVTSDQARHIVGALDERLGGGRNGVRFHVGVEYRHICVAPLDWSDASCVPPHDLTGRPVVWPSGSAASGVRALMDASRPVVNAAAAEVGSVATQIWLWGQGVKPELPSFESRFETPGRLSSAVDLVRGLGVLAGIDVVDVPGATAGFDNDYGAQRDACLESLIDRDFFLLHVEATDEAGHQGRVDAKVDALERWDREVIGPVAAALDAGGERYRVLLLPDHATPCTSMTHTAAPVPYLLFDSGRSGPGGVYSETGVLGSDPVEAHLLMGRLLAPI